MNFKRRDENINDLTKIEGICLRNVVKHLQYWQYILKERHQIFAEFTIFVFEETNLKNYRCPYEYIFNPQQISANPFKTMGLIEGRQI